MILLEEKGTVMWGENHLRIDAIGCQPAGKPRPVAFNRGGRIVLADRKTKSSTAWTKHLSELAALQRPAQTIDAPVDVEIFYHFAASKTATIEARRAAKREGLTFNEARHVRHTQKPDIDNLNKLVLDCLTKLRFWTDDALVWRIHGEKWLTYDGRCGATIFLDWEE